MEVPMRAAVIFCTWCVLIATPIHSSAVSPATSDEAARLWLEAISDRSPEQWKGRQHYLYYEDYQPGEETVGSASSNPLSCNNEAVRMRRSDGKTVVRRLNRC